MSTFRPPQVPQQPRQFFTPGQAAISPLPISDGQRAAYIRQRSEVLQPFQYAVIPVAAAVVAFTPVKVPAQSTREFVAERTAILPSFIVGTAARVPASQIPTIPVAPRSMVAELEETFPFYTAGTAAAVPPPRGIDQTAAYWRQASLPMQIGVQFAAGMAAPFVPSLPLQQIVPAPRSMIIEIEETIPFYTAGIALSPPPPRPNDQAAAYIRAGAQPLQLRYQIILQPPVANVPWQQAQIPLVTVRSALAELDEALPGWFTPGATQVPQSVYPIPVAANRQDIATLQPRVSLTQRAVGSLPRPNDQAAAYLRYPSQVLQARTQFIQGGPVPTVVVLVGDAFRSSTRAAGFAAVRDGSFESEARASFKAIRP